MKKAQVNVFVALFAYSGNGGVASTIPELAIWLAKTYYELRTDERIGGVAIKVYSDTPVTLTRNAAVRDARSLGFDMILMLDSDNEPDGYLSNHTDAKPFWKTAFNFAYERLIRDIPTVIAAPYCGPPPPPVENPSYVKNGDVVYSELYGGEVPYLFRWGNRESDNPHATVKLDILTRNEAAQLTGIFPVAALPTGVCLFTLSAFEGLPQPYFKYEMTDDGAQKQSTEDVVATRDISLYWKITKGYDVLWATCDSWALHHKTKKVGRPQYVPMESISQTFADVIRDNLSANESIKYVNFAGTDRAEVDPNPPQDPDPRRGARVPADAPADIPIDRSRIGLRHLELGPDQDYVYLTDADLAEARQLVEQELAACPSGEEDDTDVDGTDVWEPASDPDYTSSGGPVKENGQPLLLKHKMVNGRKVALLPSEIPDLTLNEIAGLAKYVATKGQVDVAVVNCGAGQSLAAVEPELPAGSHLYAYDAYDPERFAQFNKFFRAELEQGRVLANLVCSGMPKPLPGQTFSLVFIERTPSVRIIKAWGEAVAHGGILAGLGSSRSVEAYAKSLGREVVRHGDVWAIEIGAPVNA